MLRTPATFLEVALLGQKYSGCVGAPYPKIVGVSSFALQHSLFVQPTSRSFVQLSCIFSSVSSRKVLGEVQSSSSCQEPQTTIMVHPIRHMPQRGVPHILSSS